MFPLAFEVSPYAVSKMLAIEKLHTSRTAEICFRNKQWLAFFLLKGFLTYGYLVTKHAEIANSPTTLC